MIKKRLYNYILLGIILSACNDGSIPSNSKQNPKLNTSDSDFKTITISPIHDENKFEGWGTSLAWWGANFGGNPTTANELSQLFFSLNESIPFHYVENGELKEINLPGLGFNIVRYNLGGGDITNDAVWYSDEILKNSRWINGPWVNESERNPDNWNWNNDSEQINMLKLAYNQIQLRNESPIVEVFANSPMWWMNNSNSSQGKYYGYDCISYTDHPDTDSNYSQQKAEYDKHIDDFAYYLVQASLYLKKDGIDINYIEPFNEPDSKWWNGKGQEGCNIHNTSTKQQILSNINKYLQQTKQDKIKLAAADYNTMSQMLREYSMLTTVGINKINVHSYSGADPYNGHQRRQIHDLAVGAQGINYNQDMKLWQSEVGVNADNYNGLWGIIASDLNNLRPSAWILWQAVDPSWGLISEAITPTLRNTNIKSQERGDIIGKPTDLYYVMAQYSRHIKPNDYLVSSSFSSNKEEPYETGTVAYSNDNDYSTIKIVSRVGFAKFKYNLTEMISSLHIANSSKNIASITLYAYTPTGNIIKKMDQSTLDEIQNNGYILDSDKFINDNNLYNGAYTLEIKVKKNDTIFDPINRLILHSSTKDSDSIFSTIDIENHFYNQDWFLGTRKITCPANVGYYMTGIAQNSNVQCSLNAKLSSGLALTETEVVTNDTTRPIPTNDWATGLTKLQCSNGKAMVGITSDLISGIICAKPNSKQLSVDSCVTKWFDKNDSTTINFNNYPQDDFAVGSLKANVEDDEYIAGIAYWSKYKKSGAILVCKI
ncbi:MAG: glycoside hydrolase [Burkholderiales bacterium]|nr:glycoside hydrolase [Burkholderiales bacterium]